jgi:hypothetical protein
MRTLGVFLATVALAACGDDAPGTDAGDGSETLLVNASIDGDGDGDGAGADMTVRVRRAGVDVNDAIVEISSNHGEVSLASTGGGGEYRGGQPLWGDWYEIRVTAGDDWLDGGVEAPVRPALVTPDPAAPFDVRAAEDGLVRVAWDGEAAQTIRVRAGDYDASLADTGSVMVPATMFTDEEEDIELRRENATALAGGAPGSDLSAHIDSQTRVIVLNPF